MGCSGSTPSNSDINDNGASSKPPKGNGGFHESYVLDKKLGEGAFSIVHLATKIGKTKSLVAVKIVDRSQLPAEDEASLLQEVEILRSIKHPNIISIFDFFPEKDQFYVVLEYAEGGELFDRIVEKTFYNEKEARSLSTILLKTIKFCHDKSIVHRDLKPENLLLASKTEDITIKIADFGFAVKSKTDKSLTTQCGTPGYVAPEILLSKPYGRAVDMWSIGVIIFILLGGYPPFSDNNQSKLYKKIKAGQFEFHKDYWDAISNEAKDLITKLLTVDPEARYSADQALTHPWIDLTEDRLASDLNINLAELKKYQAQRRFKAAGRAVMAVNKMTSLAHSTKKDNDKTAGDNSRTAEDPTRI